MFKQYLFKGLFNRFEEDFSGVGDDGHDPADPADDPYSDDDGGDSFDQDADYSDDNGGHRQAPTQEQMIPLSAFNQMAAAFRPQAPQAAQQQMSQEDMDKALRVFKPTAKHIERLFNSDNLEDQVAVLSEILASQSEHTQTVMGYAMRMQQEQISQQYSPVLQMVEKQKMSQFVGGVIGQYPALKGHDRLVEQAIQTLKAQGYQPASGADAARAIAGQVESLIKTVNPNFSVSARPNQQRQQTTMPAMASLGGGNTGRASGAAGSRGGKKEAFNEIWD
jgi:hypothetical protein